MKIFCLVILFICMQVKSESQQIKKWKITDITQMIEKSDSILIINFWGTFCKPCVEEIPDFIKLTKKYSKQKVALYLVSLDLADYYPAKIKKFVAAKKYAATVAWLDESNADYFCPLISPEWSGSIPATLFVNKKKGYRKFFEKKLSAAEIENEIKLAL
jgi:thiol-disulfide isomerase/thioredoxin